MRALFQNKDFLKQQQGAYLLQHYSQLYRNFLKKKTKTQTEIKLKLLCPNSFEKGESFGIHSLEKGEFNRFSFSGKQNFPNGRGTAQFSAFCVH